MVVTRSRRLNRTFISDSTIARTSVREIKRSCDPLIVPHDKAARSMRIGTAAVCLLAAAFAAAKIVKTLLE